VEVRVHTDAEEIVPAWWGLWRRAANTTAFQSPAWLVPWGRQFADECAIVAGYEDDALVVLVPLFRHEERWMLWGAGTTDWLDGIFAPNVSVAPLIDAFACLDGPLELFQLPPTSALVGLAEDLDAPILRAEFCVILGLDTPLPANAARNFGYYCRRTARAGAVGPGLVGAAGFEALVELHTRRWRERGEPGVLSDPKVLAWHREAAPQLEAAGLLRLYGITLDERIVGALYALSAKGTTHYYLSGYDPELSALGLGTVLVGHAIKEARRASERSFDFLRGQEAYKYLWGATDRPSCATHIDLREPALAQP
jgi:CelD/BcsL family acetyltransferase involved in cellulose biosynthesis